MVSIQKILRKHVQNAQNDKEKYRIVGNNNKNKAALP